MIILTEQNNVSLVPGKKITYLEGMILSIKPSQWGITGKIQTKEGKYNYKLRNLELMERLALGMELVIQNGFCITDKEKNIVATDGKFGTADTFINLERYYKIDSTNKIVLTCKIKSIKQVETDYFIEIEQILPPKKINEVFLKNEIILEEQGLFKNPKIKSTKIFKIEGEKIDRAILVKKLELLPEDHFWYKFLELDLEFPKKMSLFNHIIFRQLQVIEEQYNLFKNLMFDIGIEVSKTSLVELRDALYSKVLDSELKFPYNILITKKEIERYFEHLLEYCRGTIDKNNQHREADELISTIKYYYPSLKTKIKRIE
ncbi:MAG: hypothetical protein ACTSSF_04710 [Candidatus Heimdallarchaeaceae archaeon]